MAIFFIVTFSIPPFTGSQFQTESVIRISNICPPLMSSRRMSSISMPDTFARSP